MKRYGLSIIMICLLSFACIGCGKGDSSDVVGSKNPIANSRDEQPSDTINNGENDSDKGGIIVDDEDGSDNGDTPDNGEVVYQEPYATVSNAQMWTNWFVENGEVKDIKFSEYTAEIIPQESYSKFSIEWTYINEKLYLGKEQAWFYVDKLPNSEDKVLLKSWNIDYEYEGPHFRIFDINTKEILSIYPDNVEEDYHVKEVWVSSDLSMVVFFDGGRVLYYDGIQVTEIEQFKGKFDGLYSSALMVEDGKVLALGKNVEDKITYCYVYDFATDELMERKYSWGAESDEYIDTYEWCTKAHGYGWLDFRYGSAYRDGYFTIIDLLTGREDKTEIPKEKVRHVENISEDWFFVLADCGYFIEKSTGRIIAKTEYEIRPGKKDVRYRTLLVPSDEDIYFCLKVVDSEAGIIYKIELNE